jgi:hypothetical protein
MDPAKSVAVSDRPPVTMSTARAEPLTQPEIERVVDPDRLAPVARGHIAVARTPGRGNRAAGARRDLADLLVPEQRADPGQILRDHAFLRSDTRMALPHPAVRSAPAGGTSGTLRRRALPHLRGAVVVRPGEQERARSDLESDGSPPVVRSYQPLDRVGTAS